LVGCTYINIQDVLEGFSRSTRVVTSVIAKLYALRDGLLLAINHGLQFQEVELDAKIVVELGLNFGSKRSDSIL